ncbi:hypothetical protein N9Y17_00345 [Gammaproteobacteria bacterium]|nr:hypothetical protein [Gammaproteobacteria bacterium]
MLATKPYGENESDLAGSVLLFYGSIFAAFATWVHCDQSLLEASKSIEELASKAREIEQVSSEQAQSIDHLTEELATSQQVASIWEQNVEDLRTVLLHNENPAMIQQIRALVTEDKEKTASNLQALDLPLLTQVKDQVLAIDLKPEATSHKSLVEKVNEVQVLASRTQGFRSV